MAVLIGILIGGALGLAGGQFEGMIGGAFIGGIVGLVVRVARATMKGKPVAAPLPADGLAARVAQLEARVQGLEMALLRVLGDAPAAAGEATTAGMTRAAASGSPVARAATSTEARGSAARLTACTARSERHSTTRPASSAAQATSEPNG